MKYKSVGINLASATNLVKRQWARLAPERPSAQAARMRRNLLVSRDGERQFRMIADSIPQLVWMANPDGSIFWYNRRWYEYTGATPNEMDRLGSESVLDPHQPDELPSMLSIWRDSIRKGEPLEMESPLRGYDGVFRWFLTSVSPLRNSQGTVTRWFGTNTDVTDLRTARKTLHDCEAETKKLKIELELAHAQTRKSKQQAALLDLAHDAVIVRDVGAGSTISFWSRGAAATYGYPREQALGTSSHELLRTIFPEPLDMIEGELAHTGRWKGALVHTTADGSIITVASRWALQCNELGKAESVLEINRDITAQKKVERDLVEASDRLNLALKAGQIAVWKWDLLDHTVILDERMSILFGMPAENRTCLDEILLGRIHAEDREKFQNELARACETGVLTAEFRVRWPNGSLHTVCSHGEVAFQDGEPVKMTGVCWDITERKTTENVLWQRTSELESANVELKKFSRQLEASNRELQDFASVAAHDLREPLRKVQAFGDRLKISAGKANLDEKAQDYLERMLNATHRMQALIDDLLAFSRLTGRAPALEMIDLTRVAREVLSDLEERIARTGALVELEDLPTIEADPTQMRQLLQNLIGNSLKFHKPGESPRVRIHGALTTASPSADNTCQLVVEDHGIGFDEKFLDRIFTIFQRLHSRTEYDGTGIGLAICRKIAQRHGGDIAARSAPNEGATFTITLPQYARARPGQAGGFPGAAPGGENDSANAVLLNAMSVTL